MIDEDQLTKWAALMVAPDRRSILWRETLMTWPSLTIQVELAPWHWRFRWYRDDIEKACCTLILGPLQVALQSNHQPFPFERRTAADSVAEHINTAGGERLPTVHAMPFGGQEFTPCCGKHVGDLPSTDRFALVPQSITCLTAGGEHG